MSIKYLSELVPNETDEFIRPVFSNEATSQSLAGKSL